MAEKAKAKPTKPRPASETEGVTKAQEGPSKRPATPKKPAAEPPKAGPSKAKAPPKPTPTTKGSASAKSDLTTVRLELSVDCGRCMRPIVFSELTEQVTCRACLHVFDLPAPLWSRAKRGFDEALTGGRGSRRFATEFTSTYTVLACVERRRATCPCGAELDEATLVAALELGQGAQCSCGKTMSVRAASASAPLLAMAKGAVLVANERVDGPGTRARPVGFRCACGASLQADGGRRAVDCPACGLVDVPEPLWNLLRPVLPRSPMFLVLGKAKVR